MKKFFKTTLFASLLALAISFTSCQDEFEEISNGEENESITANSAAAKLITDTSSQDGSFDNIVDGVSCFAIEFPYTVNVNGLDVTLDSKEDLATVEELLDKVDLDSDIVDIIFPITITLADYTEITIASKEALLEKAKECIEGGKDDDIECIDFVYPLTVFTFDVNNQQTGNATIESDKQLRRFFAGLEGNQLVSMDFPVTLKLYDGTEVVVNTNAELAVAIESAKETCDEDDDNDHNDDDFSKERLDAYLVACPWLIHDVQRNEQDQTEQYFEYAMNFSANGSVTAKDREGNSIEGEWTTRVSNNRVLLKLEFTALMDFSLDWFVYELEEGKIKLFAEGGNKIIMKKACNVIDKDPNTLRQVLKECSWIIKKVKRDNQELDRLLGYEFNFMADGVVTLSNEEVSSEGTWEITLNAQARLVMAITMGNEPGVSFEWPLSDLRDNRLKFEIPGTGYELILERNCDNDVDDEDVVWIRGLFNDSLWEVALFSENQDPSTEAYTNYEFSFSANGKVTVYNPNQVEVSTGRWLVYRNSDNKLEMIITFGADSNFYPLANDYILLEVEENRLELKHENDNGGYDHLVLEKK
ncbi:hypothetical protein CLV91_2606 [Maribacter vaceletii]|uniref:Lipocalin-like protein n=1 Tax=Maribacter vaceletii TaxID=1206816 RepID=A0A495E697_9FLAO|nr:hypothetical protein [Maribacter vaceletii]RKR12475.1 hypothetical protein CLV91_2606 [Maribacter vaceletii]